MASRIKPTHVVVNDNTIHIIDSKGKLWMRPLGKGGQWHENGELPEDPDAQKARVFFGDKPNQLK